ncbi:MAG: protein kinase [bacterium]
MAFPNFYKFKINQKIADKLCYTLYDAEDRTEGNRVFLKVLNAAQSRNENSVYNFLNNARILHSMEHPNIARVHQFGSDLGYYFIASEAIDLAPLSSLVQDEFSLSPQDLVEIFTRIAKTLRHAHLKGLTHGLLNTDNIYISTDGSIKIDDMGLSWFVPDIFKISNEESLYLARYVCPGFYHQESGDGRADIYSLGIILVHLITGRVPFHGTNIQTIQDLHRQGELPDLDLIQKDLPEEFESIIHKSLDWDGPTRFHNLKDYISHLEKIKKNVLTFSYSSSSSFEPEDTVTYEPVLTQQHFADDNHVKKTKTEPVVVVQAGKMVGNITSFLTSRNFLLSAAALFIIFSLAFVGSSEFNIPFLASNDATQPALESEAPLTSNISPPTFFSTKDNDPDFEKEAKETENLISSTLGTNRRTGTVFNKKERTEAEALPEKTVDLVKTSIKKAARQLKSKPKPGAEPKNVIKKSKKTTPIVKPVTTTAKTKPKTSRDKPKVASKPPVFSKPKNTKKTEGKKKVQPSKLAGVKFQIKSENKPIEAFVFINDKFRGKSDKKGRLEIKNLETGKIYKAKVSKEGYATVTKDFKAHVTPAVLAFDMKPKLDIFGTLILDARPKADSILVDGKLYRGQMPLKLSIPWGEHKVRFVNKRLKKKYDQVINLKVGQVLRIRHDFATVEKGKVAVSLKNAAQFGFAFVYVDGKIWGSKPNTTPVEISLPVGSHTIEVRREGFNAIPRDIIVVVDTKSTKFVSFTLTKNP